MSHAPLQGVAAFALAALVLVTGDGADALATARDLALEKRWPEVVSTLEEFLRFEASRPEIDALLGEALAQLGRKDEAAHYLDRALAAQPPDGRDAARLRKALVQCDTLATRRDALFKKISKDLLQCAVELEGSGHAERALEIAERLRPISTGPELETIAGLADRIRSATEEVDLDSNGGTTRPAEGWPEVALESEHYWLRAHLEPGVVEVLARTMDEIHGFYVQVYFDGDAKGTDPRKPTIFIHPSHAKMLELWQGGTGTTPGGWWSPGEWVVHAYDTRTNTGSLDEMLITLFHEASHHFMTLLEKGGNTPAWVNEGTASFFEGATALADGRVLWPDAARHRLQGLDWMLKGQGGPGVPNLVDVISYDSPSSYPGEYYEFGWGLVYFLQQYEDPSTLEYVYRPLYIRYRDEIIQKGGAPRELFERVFLGPDSPLEHENLLEFERDWRRWIQGTVYPLHFGADRRELRLAAAHRYLAAASAVAKDKKAKPSANELRLRALGHIEHVRTKIDGDEHADAAVLLLQADVLESVGKGSSAAPILERLLEMAGEGEWEAADEQIEALSKRLAKLDSRNAPLRVAQARSKGLARAASKLLGDYRIAKTPMPLRSYTFARLAADALDDAALSTAAGELRKVARDAGLLRGSSYHVAGPAGSWKTIFTNEERAFEVSPARIVLEGVRPVGRLCTSVAVSGEYDLRARISREGEARMGQGHGLVVSGTESGDWMVVMLDPAGKLYLKRMVLLTSGGRGTSDQVVQLHQVNSPPPAGEPFEMAVHVDSVAGTIEVRVGGDGPYLFRAPIALPSVAHVGVYAKNGRMVVENAVVEQLP